MKNIIKGIVIGIIITTMLMSTVLGAQVKKTIEVVYNSVNLMVNGSKINADNILYDGTTYVPIRAVAEALGKEVGWDQATSTASVNDKGTVPKEEAKEPVEPIAGETLSQKNAVKKAKDYLAYSAFSKSGLVKQLEFEGFSNSDATYAVSQLSTDWKEEAYKQGKAYLDYSSFSRDGLIKQLEFEGYTNAEALYAVNKIGL